MFYIYSKVYGWYPLRFLVFKKKNFYRARQKWLTEHKNMNQDKTTHICAPCGCG